MPDIAAFGEHKHVAGFLVYVDDLLAAGPRDVLQPLLARLLDVWNPECLKDRRTPGEPESFFDKPHVEPHAQKARVKHPPLQPGQDPLEHTPVMRLVGALLWVSLRTRPDIAWAVARRTRLEVFEMDLACRFCSMNRSRI